MSFAHVQITFLPFFSLIYMIYWEITFRGLRLPTETHLVMEGHSRDYEVHVEGDREDREDHQDKSVKVREEEWADQIKIWME